MATPEEREAEQRRRAAAAAVAGGTLVVVGDTAQPAADVPPAAARAAAAGAILAALVAFLATQRARMRGWLAEQMRRRAPQVSEADIASLLAEEEGRQAEFERRQAERFARDLTTALAIPDAAQREGAVRGLTAREQRYARQRDEAMAARAFAAVDRVVLRQQSPMGAFWKLDPTVREHTAGCLIMGGKFWPWEVLNRVHPPRHAGCPCRLLGYGEAIAEGLMAPGQVLDVQTAVRRAAAVVMEGVLIVDPRDAEALIEAAGGRELMEMRCALMAADLVADEAALDVRLTEAYDPNQPRWPKGHPQAGQWRPKLGAGLAGRRSSAGWMARDIDELRALVQPRQVGTRWGGDGPEEPIMRGPSTTAELTAVGASVAKIAERYGTHRADRERIDALHAERREISDRQWARVEAYRYKRKTGIAAIWAEEEDAAKREGRSADPNVTAKLYEPGERERLKAIDDEVVRLLKQEERGQRDAIVAVLSEVREMGGTLRVREVKAEADNATDAVGLPVATTDAAPGEVEALRASLREVQRLVPKAWADASNAGAIGFRLSDKRAWHRLESGGAEGRLNRRLDQFLDFGATFVGYHGANPVLRIPEGSDLTRQPGVYELSPNGVPLALVPDEERAVVPGPRRPWRADSTIRVRADDPSTLLHELAHRFEDVYGERNVVGLPPLLSATTRFLRERAGDDEPKKLSELTGSSTYEDHEVAWADEFVNAYIGKDYAGRATEVLTMGLQAIFYPVRGREFTPPASSGRRGDEPMRDFILGLLAAV